VDTITERIDRVTHIPQERLSDTPPAPRSCKIELVARCSARCKFCALTLRAKQPTKDMDPALFRRIVAEMAEAGVEEIGMFLVGESTLNPGLLVDAIRYANGLGLFTFLTSNATHATPDLVESMMAAGLDSLKWSVTAADEAQYVEILQISPRMFHRAKAHIRAAWEIREAGGYATQLSASSIRYDAGQAEKMRAMLAADILPYVDQHYDLPLYTFGSLATASEEYLGFRPSPGNMGRADAPVPPLPCWLTITEAHVLVDGRLTTCSFDSGDDERWTMGDLNTQSFMSAWHSEKFRALRRAHLRRDVRGTACEDCAMYGTSARPPAPSLLQIDVPHPLLRG